MDGIDISDERFGSSTTSIPASGIQEFQLSQSNPDLSTELTTSGAVNVTTRSGTNDLHGEAFGFFRDSYLAAKLPAPPGLQEPSQRSQYGGRFGGPIIRSKFFYLIDGERTLQHEQAPVLIAQPFQQYSGGFSSPFRETDLMAKADYQLTSSLHAFYRFNYFQNSFTANGGFGFSLYDEVGERLLNREFELLCCQCIPKFVSRCRFLPSSQDPEEDEISVGFRWECLADNLTHASGRAPAAIETGNGVSGVILYRRAK